MHLTDCGKRFFGSSDGRIFPIEMILNVCDNRMCFDQERRIVLTEANFVTCVDRQCAFHGYCPMDEHIVPQRARLGPHPCHISNAEKVYMTRCRHGGEFQFRELKSVRRNGSEEMGG